MLSRRRPLIHCSLVHAPPDAVTLELLARLRLTAQRLSCELVFDDVPDELCSLAELAGLREVLFGRSDQPSR